jgi:hypothetical protein
MGSPVVPFSDLPQGSTLAPQSYSDLPPGASLAPPRATSPPAPTGISALLQNLLPQSVLHPIQAAQELASQTKAHPIQSLISSDPAIMAIQSVLGGAKRSIGELQQARAASDPATGGNAYQGIQHLIRAIPIAGPAMMNAAEKPDVGGTGSYLGDMASVYKSPSAMGTLLGASAQLAPLALGGLDTALPDRPVVGQLPSLARAGDMHAQLNQSLANQNVPLNSTLAPLQRATEIAGRGGSMPKSVSDLLTRSQSPIDMTYPEARDYQSNLSDLSASDLMGMNKKMSGAIKQVRGGLFDDIQNAADQGGMGQDYADAMKASRQAYAVQDAGQFLKKHAISSALTGAGLYEGYKLINGVTGGSK